MTFAVVAVPDLLFQSRIEAALRVQAIDVRVPASGDACAAMLAEAPALLVIDLHADTFDAPPLIRASVAAGAKVLAFGRHTAPEVLRAAREAGADRVVPRSQLAEELPSLLEGLLAPHPATGHADR